MSASCSTASTTATRTSSWSVRATSGCPVAMRVGRGRLPRHRLRARHRRASPRCGPAGPTSRTCPSERIAAALRRAATAPTDQVEDLAGFDVAVISVPTPLRDGAPDLSYVESAARDARPRAAPAARSSSSSPRPTRARPRSCCGRSSSSPACGPARTSSSATRPSASTPATRRGRSRTRRRSSPASTTTSLRAVEAFYGALVEKVVPVGSPAEAELVKLLENTFRHVNIALVNELAMFAGDLGVDIWRAIDAASTKPFGYMRFTPGPGRRRPLPAGRPVVPVVAGAAAAPGSRSGSSSSPTTSTSTCPTTSCAASPRC